MDIRSDALAPWEELARHEQEKAELKGRVGASGVFVGTMRDFNDASDVTAMHLEHYPGMTEKHLERICEEAGERWELLDTLVIHRVGDILPAEPIVLVAVWSEHRKDAFEACRFIMEDLKSKAPFWKKESLADGTRRWVEKNTAGY